MTSVATICIPVANYHENLVDRAVASANAQTVECDVMVYFDKDKRGAGYARNQAALHTETDFIIFLDADDTLEPDYVEQCLLAYERGRYIYTGWYEQDQIYIPWSETPFRKDSFHLVTALIPFKAFEAVGGFDESLPGHEDVDLFFKLNNLGICGTLVQKPLVHYSPFGQRSIEFQGREDYDDIRRIVYERNGGDRLMGCCGGTGQPAGGNPGDKQEGDVKAIATWAGIRSVTSQDGVRVYRGGNWNTLWVAPADIAARPDMFKKIYEVSDLTPERDETLRKAGLL